MNARKIETTPLETWFLGYAAAFGIGTQAPATPTKASGPVPIPTLIG